MFRCRRRRRPEIEAGLCIEPWRWLRMLKEANADAEIGDESAAYKMEPYLLCEDRYIFRIFNTHTNHSYCVDLKEIRHGTPFALTFLPTGLEWYEWVVFVRMMLRVGYTISDAILTMAEPSERWVIRMEQRRHDASAQRGLSRWRAFVSRRQYLRRKVWNAWMARAGRPGEGTLYKYWAKKYAAHCEEAKNLIGFVWSGVSEYGNKHESGPRT